MVKLVWRTRNLLLVYCQPVNSGLIHPKPHRDKQCTPHSTHFNHNCIMQEYEASAQKNKIKQTIIFSITLSLKRPVGASVAVAWQQNATGEAEEAEEAEVPLSLQDSRFYVFIFLWWRCCICSLSWSEDRQTGVEIRLCSKLKSIVSNPLHHHSLHQTMGTMRRSFSQRL